MASRETVTWSLPVGLRSAIFAEASRRNITPSRVAAEVLERHLASDIAEAIDETIRRSRESDLIVDDDQDSGAMRGGS